MTDDLMKKTFHAISDVEKWIERLCKHELACTSPAQGICEIDYRSARSQAISTLAIMIDNVHQEYWSDYHKIDQQIELLTKERDEALLERAKIDSPSSPAVRSAVHALTNGHCAYCDDKLDDDWQVEHVVPASLGGPDSIANYVPSCKPCNHKKSTKHVIEFIKLRRGKFTVVEGDKAAEA